MGMPASVTWEAPEVTVQQASRRDAPALYDTLTLAFAADPPVRWLYPEPRQYLHFFPAFVEAFGGAALARGTAWFTPGYSGAALWFAPGSEPDEAALSEILEESISEDRKPEAFTVFEEMATYHPEGPHWYLPLIGVEPTSQGQGLGSALMREALRRCDQAGLPAYLESSNPANIPFYRRHGFEVLAEIRVGRCPPIFPMLRDSQS